MAVSFQVTFDCANPDRVAQFWAKVLGYKVQDPPQGFATWPEFLKAQNVPEDQWDRASAIVDPDGKGGRIFFQKVPEGKTIKNRVHLDVNVGGGYRVSLTERMARVNQRADELAELGATRVADHEDKEMGEYHIVMQDVEGNEFCLQ